MRSSLWDIINHIVCTFLEYMFVSSTIMVDRLGKNSNFQSMSPYGLDIYYNVVTVDANQDYLIKVTSDCELGLK